MCSAEIVSVAAIALLAMYCTNAPAVFAVADAVIEEPVLLSSSGCNPKLAGHANGCDSLAVCDEMRRRRSDG
jgi:uncharacterized membrane protein